MHVGTSVLLWFVLSVLGNMYKVMPSALQCTKQKMAIREKSFIQSEIQGKPSVALNSS